MSANFFFLTHVTSHIKADSRANNQQNNFATHKKCMVLFTVGAAEPTEYEHD